jgi:2-iminobutanoate/2-iminopropanoate deaminase
MRTENLRTGKSIVVSSRLSAVAMALFGITVLCYLLAGAVAGQRTSGNQKGADMKREVIRVEPLSTYMENWKAPTSAVARAGDTIYVSGLPPFDPGTGTVIDRAPIERQAQLVLDQMKLCLEAAGSDLEHVVKCIVYCTSVDKFAAVNEVYARYFPEDPPARIFISVPAWPGPFDIEIDCIAIRKDD